MKTTLMRGARLPDYAFFEGEDDQEYDIDLDKALASPKAKQKLETWAERTIAAGLKQKNGEILGQLTRYKLPTDDGTEAYIDPEEAKAAITFQKTEGKNTGEKIQNAVQDATHRLEGQLSAAAQKAEQAEGKIGEERGLRHSQKIGYELRDSLRESGIKSGKLPLHERYLREFMSVDVDDKGNESILIVDDKGQPRYGKDGLMTLKEFVEEYRDREDISDDWHAEKEGGSGHTPGGRPRGAPAIDPNLSPTERLRQHRRNEDTKRQETRDSRRR